MKMFILFVGVLMGFQMSSEMVGAEPPVNIYQAILGESNQATPEISTKQMQKALTDKKTMVFDTRSYKEYGIDHLPGAINAVSKSEVSKNIFDAAIARISRLAQGNKAAPIVLYCNGPVCGKSRKVAKLLVKRGFVNVRRYQLGIPIWRVLKVVTESNLEGVLYVLQNDKTAVLIDVRNAEAYHAGTIPGARNIPLSRVTSSGKTGEIQNAKKDGRLPVDDHNTRIIVFGHDAAQARALVEALAQKASFHNVSYFSGSYGTLRDALN